MSKATTGNRKKSALGRGLGSLLGEPLEPVDVPIIDDLEVEEDSTLSEGFIEAPTRLSEEKATAKVEAKEPIEPSVPDNARVWQVGIENLIANQDQPRKEFKPEALKELSASIKEQGILQPIVARKLENGKFEIIAGERRWRAAGLAGMKEVPVILKETSDQNALELALIENIQRQDLNPIEEAEAYELLMETYDLTQQQVAEKVGKDRATVANLVRLLNLVADMRKAVAQGDLPMGQAKLLLSLQDDALQRQVGLKVIKEKLTVRATEKLVQQAKNPKTDSESVGNEGDIDVSRQLMKGLSEELQKTIGTKVSIEYSKGKGKVSVHFYSDDELNQFVDRIRASWQS